MSSATVANSVNLLKRLWGSDVPSPMYKASKLLAMCKKDSKFTDEGRYIVVTLAPTGGGGADFGEAVLNQQATTEARLFVTRAKEYQVWSLDNEAIMATKGDRAALVDLVRHSADKARYAYARASAQRVWGDRGGTIGRLDAAQNLALSVVTLRERTDIKAFDNNMTIMFAPNDGTGTGALPTDVRGGGAVRRRISALDRTGTTATFTVIDPATGLASALNTIPGITANDFIVRSNDFTRAKTGAKGYLPATDPTAGDSFFGYDRSTQDVQRISGVKHDGLGGSKIDTLIQACAEGANAGVGAEKASTFTAFVNPIDYADLQKDRESVRHVDANIVESKIGFKALELATALGAIMIVSETDAPRGFCRIFDTSEVYSRCAGEDPMDLVGMNGGLLVYESQDKRQGRIGSYGNYFWENPGNAITVTW